MKNIKAIWLISVKKQQQQQQQQLYINTTFSQINSFNKILKCRQVDILKNNSCSVTSTLWVQYKHL